MAVSNLIGSYRCADGVGNDEQSGHFLSGMGLACFLELMSGTDSESYQDGMPHDGGAVVEEEIDDCFVVLGEVCDDEDGYQPESEDGDWAVHATPVGDKHRDERQGHCGDDCDQHALGHVNHSLSC